MKTFSSVIKAAAHSARNNGEAVAAHFEGTKGFHLKGHNTSIERGVYKILKCVDGKVQTVVSTPYYEIY